MQLRRVYSAVLRYSAVLVALAGTFPARADIRLPAIFGSNMVLQQQADAPIWGWADPGETVTIMGSWGVAAGGAGSGGGEGVVGVGGEGGRRKEMREVARVKADDSGRWRAKVRTPAASSVRKRVGDAGADAADAQGTSAPHAAHTITITGSGVGSKTITLENILFGEVWLCSGQSNMEMPVGDVGPGYRGVVNWRDELAVADFPAIRLFTVQNAIAPAPLDDCSGMWLACSPETVRAFSATGYFFGRELHLELAVPVGLISADWGGTAAEAWTSEDTLAAQFPEFADALEFVRSQRGGNIDAAAAWGEAMRPWWGKAAEIDPGTREHWEARDHDDTGWGVMDLPGHWKGELEGFDGILWLRRTVFLPFDWEGRDLMLRLAPIDDMDTVWINGRRVGGVEVPGSHDRPRAYHIPGGVARAGANTLAMRILDTGGPGGLTGDDTESYLFAAGNDETDRVSVAGEWKYRRGAAMSELPRIEPPRLLHANSPTALFNGMIAPLRTFAMRGAIWYQGESNIGRAAQYARLFPAMIGDWRIQWQQGDFPFYYVQIAPFGYRNDNGAAARLREAQLKSLTTPNTGMAVTMDIGEPADIHPANKQEVGRRLALWALAKTYGEADIACSGPLYKSMAIDNGAIRVRFEHAAGLRMQGDVLKGFQIAGKDGRFVPAKAVIDGNSVLVVSNQVLEPAAVRYGWEAAPEANLFNGAGLPASPFRTDDWP